MIIKKEFKLMNKLINHIEKRIIKYKFKRKVYISIIDINKIDYIIPKKKWESCKKYSYS